MSERHEHQALETMQSLIRERIAKDGVALQGVFPVVGQVDPEPPFAYTIGMTTAGLPELIVIGSMEPQVQENLLNNAIAVHTRSEFKDGDVTEEIATVPFRIRTATVDHHIQQALNYYDDPQNKLGRVRLLQLVWPDRKGAYPGQFVWDETLKQPLI